MTFVFHLLGFEVFRFSFGQLEDEPEFISNAGGEFDLALPFGFSSPQYEDEDE